ncbi:MAG: DUF4397 domain-containing protein [Ferruginibacter sp.]
MKIVNVLLVVLVAAVLYSSCDKNANLLDENNKWVYVDSANAANIKIVQVFAGNTPQVPTAPNLTTGPQVFVYANGAKLNGTSLSYGGAWPTPNVYATIPAGSTKFDVINGRMDLTVVPNVPKFIAGDTLNSLTVNLAKGKYYTLYIGDTVPSVQVTLKEDNLVTPDYQMYKIRVANLLMNPTDTLTLYSTRQNAEVISNITHKNVSDWVQLPLPILSDTLVFRKKGTTTSYVQVNGFVPVGQRMYTMIGRGKTGVTGKTPVASIIINR